MITADTADPVLDRILYCYDKPNIVKEKRKLLLGYTFLFLKYKYIE